MDLNEYQEKIVEIWESDKDSEDLLLFCCVGMAEEAGECMGKIKRAMRGEGFDRQCFLLELGDCLAYWAMANYAYSQIDKQWVLNNMKIPLLIPRTLLRHSISLFEECFHCLDKVDRRDFEGMCYFLTDVFTAIRGCLSSPEIKGTFAEVAELNLDKLYDRKARLGTLKGSGDSR